MGCSVCGQTGPIGRLLLVPTMDRLSFAGREAMIDGMGYLIKGEPEVAVWNVRWVGGRPEYETHMILTVERWA